MQGILIDVNIEGHALALMVVLTGEVWGEFWAELNLRFFQFSDFALSEDSSDRIVWQACQQHQLILLTANRNQDSPDSLETTLRELNQADSLPVFTLGNADQVLVSGAYARRVVARVLEYLHDVENLRGTGRLYLP